MKPQLGSEVATLARTAPYSTLDLRETGPGPAASDPGYVPSNTGRCAGPRRLIRPFQATWPSRTSPGNRAVSRARAIEASSLLNDLLMQRTKLATGRYSGPDYFTLD